MLVESRFGTSETDEKKIIRFPSGLPGFEDLHEFIIIEVEDTKPIYWLQSTENKHIALPVIISFAVLDNYDINIRENELEGLNAENTNDLLILNVVVIPEDVKKMTANLAAPVIINVKQGIGKQIVIDAAEFSLRHPIYEAIQQSLQGGGRNAGANA